MSTPTTPKEKLRISRDGGLTWKEFEEVVAVVAPAPAPTPIPPAPAPAPAPTPIPPAPAPAPAPTTTPTSGGSVALIMHANWLSNADFDQIAQGNLDSTDQIRYRCTEYPNDYDQARVTHLFNNYRAKIPGLKVGISVGFYNMISANAAKFKQLGFDFVEYNLENAFDGPNDDSAAKSNLEKVRQAADAVHAQGMMFRVTPGKPNSTSFIRTGLIDDVARLVDYYHIQAQSIQDTTPAEYANFTEGVVKPLKAAKPGIMVTSQISPSQGASTGKTVQQTMRDAIAASMAKPAPGNTVGAGMWIGGTDVAEAKSFFAWFKGKYTS